MTFRVLCCCAALSLAASYAAACDNPPLAQVPTAEEVEDLAAEISAIQSDVEEYHANMEAFTECLRTEVEAARSDDAPDLVQNLLVQRNNAAVAEVQAVIEQFNQLVEQANAGSQIEQE